MYCDVIFEQPYCHISDSVNKKVAKRQTTSRYLNELSGKGVFRKMTLGKEKLFIHPKPMLPLSRDSNQFVHTTWLDGYFD